jgi:hypothetical protein
MAASFTSDCRVILLPLHLGKRGLANSRCHAASCGNSKPIAHLYCGARFFFKETLLQKGETA